MADSGLSSICKKALIELRDVLCDNMKPGEQFLNILGSRFVLTTNEIKNAKAEKTDYGRSSCIIEYIRRGTEKNYNDFLTALDETNQKHLADSLRKRGGVF